jgi:type IV pilus assembly protein PilW
MNNVPCQRANRAQVHSQSGVTLIELMIAMTLALAILAGVGYTYIQGKDGFRVQDNQARLQENVRLVYTIVSRDLMMAGHFGCAKPSIDSNLGVSNVRITASQPVMTADTAWLETDNDQTNRSREFDPGNMVRGFDNGAGWQVPSSITGKRLAGTDTLIIVRGGDDFRHLSGAVEGETDFKIASPLPGVTTDGRIRPMVISNCAYSEIIKPTIRNGGLEFSVANKTNENTAATYADTFAEQNTLTKADYYNELSTLTTFEPVSYFVGLAKGSNGVQVPSLHRVSIVQNSATSSNNGLWDTTPDVVVEGVERLQIRYLRPDRGGALETAAEITAAGAWAQVSGVQIDVTVVSDENSVRTESTTQTVGATSVTDNRLRLTSTFVVQLRNPRV